MPNTDKSKLEAWEPRQQAFFREYLKDFNGTQAYIRAGYGKRAARSNAYHLLQQAKRLGLLAKLVQQVADHAEVAATQLTQVLWREAQGEGPDTNASARVRAAELLGKRIGYFPPEEQIQKRVDITFTMDIGKPKTESK